MMVLTKVSGLGDVVDGDARVKPEGSSGSTPANQLGSAAPNRDAAPKIRPRNPNRTGRHHQVENGRYTSNRTGYALCDSYNEGRCENTVSGGCVSNQLGQSTSMPQMPGPTPSISMST